MISDLNMLKTLQVEMWDKHWMITLIFFKYLIYIFRRFYFWLFSYNLCSHSISMKNNIHPQPLEVSWVSSSKNIQTHYQLPELKKILSNLLKYIYYFGFQLKSV